MTVVRTTSGNALVVDTNSLRVAEAIYTISAALLVIAYADARIVVARQSVCTIVRACRLATVRADAVVKHVCRALICFRSGLDAANGFTVAVSAAAGPGEVVLLAVAVGRAQPLVLDITPAGVIVTPLIVVRAAKVVFAAGNADPRVRVTNTVI